jgi:hypothetical protein
MNLVPNDGNTLTPAVVLGYADLSVVRGKKTRRARDMPQIHICRFTKKAVDHVVKHLFSIQCTVDGRLTTLALAVLTFFVFPVHSIHSKGALWNRHWR